MTSAIAVADDLGASPIAWVEAAQAVRQLRRAAGVDSSARWAMDMEGSCSISRTGFRVLTACWPQLGVERFGPRGPAGETGAGEVGEIKAAFAGAEVGADGVGVEAGVGQAGHEPGLVGGTESEAGVAADFRVFLGGRAECGGKIKVFDFGREGGGEGAGVEESVVGDTGFTGEETTPDGGNIVAEGSDPAEA